MLDKAIANKINQKKNDDVEFKLKKKRTINFEIVTTANEKNVIMKKKVSIKNNNFYMFKIFDVKNSIERISTKHHIDNITSFLNLFETSIFNVEIFSR